MTTVEDVRKQLHEVIDPCSAATGSNLDIVEMGLIDSINITDSHVDIKMLLTTPTCHMVPYFAREIEDRVSVLPGIDSVGLETDLGMKWTEEMMSDKAKQRRRELSNRQAAKYRDELKSSNMEGLSGVNQPGKS